MKKHTFPIAAVCIWLASVLLLTGCMYAVVGDMGASKEYTAEIVSQTQSDVIIDGETPTAQSEMQKKFNVYLHETESSVRIFSQEQFHELREIRNSGERVPLTYDEVLYLIANTIHLYFTYDEIKLTKANVLEMGYFFLQGDGSSDGDDLTFETYHGDFSEFATGEDGLTEAYAEYNETVSNIAAIISYRLYMHDAGFRILDGYRDSTDTRHPLVFTSGLPSPMYIALSLDGSTVGGEENTAKLERELGKYLSYLSDGESSAAVSAEPLGAKLLLIQFYTYSELDGTIQIYSDDFVPTQVYPTVELIKRAPETEVTLTASLLTEHNTRQTLQLDRETGRFQIAWSDPINLRTLEGDFSEINGYLALYPTNLGDEKKYVYRFYKRGNYDEAAYVYNSLASVPHDDFPLPDGMAFCIKPNEYLLEQAIGRGSGVTYTVGDDSYRVFNSIPRSVQISCADGMRGSIQTDILDFADIAENRGAPTIRLIIGKNQAGRLIPSLPLGAEIKTVTLHTFGAGPTETETTFEALSDLQDGEYYVSVDIKITETYCGVQTTRWVTDFFQLLVTHA